jgi:hypothetical protein
MGIIVVQARPALYQKDQFCVFLGEMENWCGIAIRFFSSPIFEIQNGGRQEGVIFSGMSETAPNNECEDGAVSLINCREMGLYDTAQPAPYPMAMMFPFR